MLLADVNFLIALAWPTHQAHRVAVDRLGSSDNQWATCALTQLGFVRVSSIPGVVGLQRTLSEACDVLERLCADERHVFVAELPGVLDLNGWEQVYGHQKTTDHYLVRLAESIDATLLTFDTRVAHFAWRPESVEVLPLDPG